jgi:hypothetical protein
VHVSFNPLSGSTPRGEHQGELPLKGLIHNLEEVWVGFTIGGVLPSAYLYSKVDTVSNRFKNENEYGKKSWNIFNKGKSLYLIKTMLFYGP